MPLDTQNPYLDALGGSAWQPIDGSVKLSFIFDVSGSAGAWTAEEALTGAQAVGAWLDVANIDFGDPNEVADGYTIQILKSGTDIFSDPSNVGKGTYPDLDPPHNVYLNTSSPAWVKGGFQPGSIMFATLIHELGHALGLAHPHDTDMNTGVFPGIELLNPDGTPRLKKDIETDKGDNFLNSMPYTIMGYNLAPNMEETNYDLGLGFDEGFMVTPGAFDIAAIQKMYGAVAHNEGNDVYILHGNYDGAPNASFTTIWDTGGIDTIEYDGSGDPRIDNDAGTSTVIDLRYATLKDEPGGGGFISQFRGNSENNGGFTIAADPTDFDHNGVFGVIIENAIGGPGRDELIGNEFANELSGRGGNDTLRGGRGDDKLSGGSGNDTFEFDADWGQDTITDFEVGQGAFGGDHLVFANTISVASMGQFEIDNSGVGGFLKITFGGQSITFNGLHKGDLRAENFSFNRKLEDGYVSGATVFADADGDGELDAGESSTTTDASGTFVLTGGSGPLVAFGGTDISTRLPFAGKLMAPEGSIVITPLTTLLVGGASESDILAAFNLPAGFDLRLGDPIAGLLAGHAGSAAVFVAGVKVIDTVIGIATAIAGLGGDTANAQGDAFKVIGTAVSNLSAGATLDLSNAATIAALFTSVAQLEGISASQVAAAVGAAIASSNAAIDQKLASDGATDALVTHVSAVQAVIQANRPPHAVDDFATATTGIGGTAGTDAAHGVLANDSDPDGDPLTVTGFTGGTHGTLALNADGSYDYTVTDLTGPTGSHLHDVFTYGITDGLGGVAVANLDITLNRAPIAFNDSSAVYKGGTVSGNVLANDSDPDGDPIQTTSLVGGTFAGTYGTLTFNADGSYRYVASKSGLPGNFVAQDTFRYSISDGNGGLTSATLSVVVLNPSQLYQAGANTTLTGGNGPDVLDGSSGHDTLFGGNGPDVLIGGLGDTLTGRNNADTFLFRPGFGPNTITDFDVNADVIQIDKSVFQTVADLLAHTSDTAAGAVINDGKGDTVTLTGVTLAQLQARAGDFHLVQQDVVTINSSSALLGQYMASTLVTASDGHGGTLISDASPNQQSLLSLPHS